MLCAKHKKVIAIEPSSQTQKGYPGTQMVNLLTRIETSNINTLSLPDGLRGRVAKRLACATLDAAVSVWSPDWGSYDVFLVRTIVRTLSSHTVSFFTLMVE